MEYDKLLITHPNSKIYEDGDKVIKVYNKGYSKAEVFHEAYTTCKVEELGLNVPTVTGVEYIDGKWHMIMNSIGGKSFAQMMSEDSENTEHYVERMVDVQINMHNKRCMGLPTLRNKLYDCINDSDIDSTKKYDLLSIMDGTPRHRKLCHGNFNPTHLIEKNGVVYITDWNHASQGNASADVARTYLWLYLYNREIADMYLQKFCDKSNTAKRYVQQWLPIVAAARLAKHISPEEEEILNEWINIVDYD